jgi:hypothetical protein|tara:strand:+ start:2665 stop:3081 length:417 start_codon:yes stop_codon:yes gene_type:complete
MSAYANDEDLVKIIPDIFDHGVDSFNDEMTRSTADVQRRIKSDWWMLEHDASNFDTTKLKASEWSRTTVYHALAYYIMPRLSNFSADDTFQRQMTFYKEKYEEEFSAVTKAGVSYDFDGDGNYVAGEVDFVDTERLYR